LQVKPSPRTLRRYQAKEGQVKAHATLRAFDLPLGLQGRSTDIRHRVHLFEQSCKKKVDRSRKRCNDLQIQYVPILRGKATLLIAGVAAAQFYTAIHACAV
jgi:hypothetical protein